ncbi:MAG: hotdog domain-containing protein [Saprospiraceae bacterium]|nr:hotdog domain-containing protein [Saprospiraceae bacterium]
MEYNTRKLLKPNDLNANNTLFGGQLLKWIDEETGIYAMTKLNTRHVVTKFMSEIDFVSSAKQGEVIEIGVQLEALGKTSITMSCEVRNLFSRKAIIRVDKIVYVKVDDQERPIPHNISLNDLKSSS